MSVVDDVSGVVGSTGVTEGSVGVLGSVTVVDGVVAGLVVTSVIGVELSIAVTSSAEAVAAPSSIVEAKRLDKIIFLVIFVSPIFYIVIYCLKSLALL